MPTNIRTKPTEYDLRTAPAPGPDAVAAAKRTVAHYALDADDARRLLIQLGLVETPRKLWKRA